METRASNGGAVQSTQPEVDPHRAEPGRSPGIHLVCAPCRKGEMGAEPGDSLCAGDLSRLRRRLPQRSANCRSAMDHTRLPVHRRTLSPVRWKGTDPGMGVQISPDRTPEFRRRLRSTTARPSRNTFRASATPSHRQAHAGPHSRLPRTLETARPAIQGNPAPRTAGATDISALDHREIAMIRKTQRNQAPGMLIMRSSISTSASVGRHHDCGDRSITTPWPTGAEIGMRPRSTEFHATARQPRSPIPPAPATSPRPGLRSR